jgi:hypothetical protein
MANHKLINAILNNINILLSFIIFSNNSFSKSRINNVVGVNIIQLNQIENKKQNIQDYYIHKKGIKEISFSIYIPDECNKKEAYLLLSKKSFDKREFISAKNNKNCKINDLLLEILDIDDNSIDIHISKIDKEDIKKYTVNAFGKLKIKFGILFKITPKHNDSKKLQKFSKMIITTKSGHVKIDL